MEVVNLTEVLKFLLIHRQHLIHQHPRHHLNHLVHPDLLNFKASFEYIKDLIAFVTLLGPKTLIAAVDYY